MGNLSGCITSLFLSVFIFPSISWLEQVQPDYTKTPVLFVHGHGMGGDSWTPLITSLGKSRYPGNFLRAIQLVPGNGPNIKAAETQIAPAVENFLSEINHFLSTHQPGVPLKTKVDLVSHSMGGLSTRWYAAKVRPDRVNKWISLAGANHGSNFMCRFAQAGDPGADDMCPAYAKNQQESRVQFELNGSPHQADIDESPYGLGTDSPGVKRIPPDERRGILYVTLRLKKDSWIVPGDSAIIDGAGGRAIPMPEKLRAVENPGGNILILNRADHSSILSDPETMEIVRIILER